MLHYGGAIMSKYIPGKLYNFRSKQRRFLALYSTLEEINKTYENVVQVKHQYEKNVYEVNNTMFIREDLYEGGLYVFIYKNKYLLINSELWDITEVEP